tara:strand:+ start:4241 stop:5086 length:846 start_codon:yes stop_codon:yes gene_type:complete
MPYRANVIHYARVSHIPNLLEAYRYFNRYTVANLSAELRMSYHTIRRLCKATRIPQERTFELLVQKHSFLDKANWISWSTKRDKCMLLEESGDIHALLQVEDELRGLLPPKDYVTPAHLIPRVSETLSGQLKEELDKNKARSFYISDLHYEGLTMLSLKAGMSKSEFIRNIIDRELQLNSDVLETVVNIFADPDKEPIPIIKPYEEVEVQSTEELSALVPDVPPQSVLNQLNSEIPDEIVEGEDLMPSDLVPAFSTPWTASVSEDTALSDSEIQSLFGREN